jgi:hypothetical protein
MACAARGSLVGVTWRSGRRPLACRAAPLFAGNDNGDIDYRAVAAAAARLWSQHGDDAPFVAAQRAQTAFWQGKMASCRWWHSTQRMLDRALVAGAARAAGSAAPKISGDQQKSPANA